MNPIQSATSSAALTPLQTPDLNNAAPSSGTSFKDFLLNSIQQVNSAQQTADAAVEKLATGGDVSPAEVLTAVQKADVAFRMMMQIRNKIVQAYEDVQNVRV
jgi:flagellar hook-basal body complex protein FliE